MVKVDIDFKVDEVFDRVCVRHKGQHSSIIRLPPQCNNRQCKILVGPQTTMKKYKNTDKQKELKTGGY